MFKMPIIPDTLYDIDVHVQDDNVSENTTTNIEPVVSAKVIDLSASRINSKVFNVNTPKSKLQEAIIWSEILGKPMCKRRRKRYNS